MFLDIGLPYPSEMTLRGKIILVVYTGIIFLTN